MKIFIHLHKKKDYIKSIKICINFEKKIHKHKENQTKVKENFEKCTYIHTKFIKTVLSRSSVTVSGWRKTIRSYQKSVSTIYVHWGDKMVGTNHEECHFNFQSTKLVMRAWLTFLGNRIDNSKDLICMFAQTSRTT